jgi:hypothetical protein
MSGVELNDFIPLNKGNTRGDSFMVLLWCDTKEKGKFTVSTYLLNAFIYSFCSENQIASLDDKGLSPIPVVHYMESPNTMAAKGLCIWAVYGSRKQLLDAVKNRIRSLKERKKDLEMGDSHEETLFCPFDEKAAKEYSWNDPESLIGRQIAAALVKGTIDGICRAGTMGMTVPLFQKLKQYREIYVSWSSEHKGRATSAAFRTFIEKVEAGFNESVHVRVDEN